jgi:hypothetical protein
MAFILCLHTSDVAWSKGDLLGLARIVTKVRPGNGLGTFNAMLGIMVMIKMGLGWNHFSQRNVSITKGKFSS